MKLSTEDTEEKQKAKKEFEIYMNEVNEDICLDYQKSHRIADDEIIKLIKEKYGVKKGSFHLLERQEMDKILKNLKAINGVAIWQLVRVTGVSIWLKEHNRQVPVPASG